MAGYIMATHSAPSNIATIKYWGKDNEALNTAINSSVSVTMSQDQICAKTTVVLSKSFTADRLFLNGTEVDISQSKRVQTVLKLIRQLAGPRTDSTGATIPAEELVTWKAHIVSENNFPTAAGLASSAAGYACLVHVLADVYAVKEQYTGQLSTIARQGSGSACRSLYGGFVRWDKGAGKADASDSMAIQVADEKYWPELSLLIFVVSDKQKETGSTDGMRASVQTSALIHHRAQHVVPARLEAIEKAYLERDFATFANITMADSNQFHAVCLDTLPPIFYMNDISKKVISLVHKINAEAGFIKAGYTFDAGPNAVVFTLAQHKAEVLAVMLAHFPPSADVEQPFVSCPTLEAEAQKLVPSLPAKLACAPAVQQPGAIRHVYSTSVGDGPRVLSEAEALANPTTGLPLRTLTGDFSKAL